jgi:hypothetical protein
MCDAIAGVTTADHSSSPSPDLDGVELGRRQRMGLSVSHPRQVRIAVPGLLTLLHQTARGGMQCSHPCMDACVHQVP